MKKLGEEEKGDIRIMEITDLKDQNLNYRKMMRCTRMYLTCVSYLMLRNTLP